MRHTVRRVYAARLSPGGVNRASPGAAPGTSYEAILGGMSIVWGYLQPEDKKTIRATCRNGRQLHDRQVTHLRLTLGQDPGQKERQQRLPSPPGLRVSLGAVVRRGARLQSVAVWFRDARDGQREAQLLAALEACSKCPLTHLELQGAVPLSGAVAEAVAACCPHLSNLVLDHWKLSRPSDAVPTKDAEAEYDHGCGQLLAQCGPRLQVLQLAGVHHWKAVSYMALRSCTALTSLELDAGAFPQGCCECDGRGQRYLESPAMEAHVISTVAQLTTLQSLVLLTDCDSTSVSPEAVCTHATCVGYLSALTALTHLQLEQSACYENHVDSWSDMDRDGDQHGAWCAVREAHRTSLLSVLHTLPRLQHLHAPGLVLQPSELASLTTLTRVSLRGLLPPPPWHEAMDLGGFMGAGCVPLPPHLHTLVLPWGASPRAYAALQPTAAFSCLHSHGLVFGMSDVTEDGRLRPEAVAAVGPAVRLLTTYCEPTPCPCCGFSVESEASSRLLQPRAGAPTGHMEWIQQLRGLDVYGRLEFNNIALRAGDLSCLGQTLSNLKRLELQTCSFPAVALPLLRNPVLALRDLYLDFALVEDVVSNSTLEPLLLVLLSPPHTGAAPLESLAIGDCSEAVDTQECVRSVTEQLEVCFGLTGVDLWVE